MFDIGKIIYYMKQAKREKPAENIEISKQTINKIIFWYNGSLVRNYFDDWKNIIWKYYYITKYWIRIKKVVARDDKMNIICWFWLL